MKKVVTRLALAACAILLAGSASAQTDTTGKPMPDTVGSPVPDDTTRMPKDKKRQKKDRKMPKDTMNRATKGNYPTAVLNAQWSNSLAVWYVAAGGEYIQAKSTGLSKEKKAAV